MPLRSIGVLAALAVASALAASAAGQQGPASPGLGLCPIEAKQRDGFTQSLCDGESALREGRTELALDRFRLAAGMPRPAATNELAWAGLAAAHCRAGELDEGRRWAMQFSEARRLWLGETDCRAAAGVRAPSPFVRSRMCDQALLADYALVRGNPQAAFAIDLHARLARIGEAIGVICGGAARARTGAATTPVEQTPAAAKADSKATSQRARKSTKPKAAGN
jgi:hypothetical protein